MEERSKFPIPGYFRSPVCYLNYIWRTFIITWKRLRTHHNCLPDNRLLLELVSRRHEIFVKLPFQDAVNSLACLFGLLYLVLKLQHIEGCVLAWYRWSWLLARIRMVVLAKGRGTDGRLPRPRFDFVRR